MSIRQLAWKSVLRNPLIYGTYFLCSSLAIMIAYLVLLLLIQPLKVTNRLLVDVAGSMLGVYLIILILCIIFLTYSLTVFVEHRQSEWQLYLILGMTEDELRLFIFSENLLVGSASLVCGLCLGLIFSRFSQLLFRNLLHVNFLKESYRQLPAVLITSGLFLAIFVFVSFRAAYKINTEQLPPADSPPAPRQRRRLQSGKVWLCGLLLIAGYGLGWFYLPGYQSFLYSPRLSFGWHIFLLLPPILVISGNFLFFRHVIPWLICKRSQMKSFYQGTHFLLYTEERTRQAQNYRLNHLLTITLMITFLGFLAVMLVSWQYTLNNKQYPYSYVLNYRYNFNGESLQQKRTTENDASNLLTDLNKAKHAAKMVSVMAQGARDGSSTGRSVMRLSDYNRVQKMTQRKEVMLSPRECFVFPRDEGERLLAQSGQIEPVRMVTFESEQGSVALEERLQDDYFLPDFLNLTVVPDAVYEQLQFSYSQNRLYIFSLQNSRDSEGAQKMVDSFNWRSTPAEKPTIYSYFLVWLFHKQQRGLLVLVFSTLAFVFFVFSIGILYFNCFSQLENMIEKQSVLHELGLSASERCRLLKRQLQILFFLPGVCAAVQFFVLVILICQMNFLNYQKSGLCQRAGGIVLVYFAVQLLFYELVSRKILRKVLLAVDSN